MHIKRLDLLGFKSFASKTSIAITRGICAVVGPNGCGKSNVVDAIRWVLGETSAHDLRGHKMEDVIFAGSGDRAPTNMAEVTIILDNEAGTAPDPYHQVPEIMVTRRLFRSGESEYLINKTAVRRLDVQMLFMDTGLGQGGYGIIEQGKISHVVDARPDELRELLEEAAGIMRFKTRKKLALKKMELTRQNLDRIQDLCLEVGRHTKRLAAEAHRARRHRSLRDQVRRLELHLALQEFEVLQQRQVTLHEELREVRGELESGHHQWRDWQGEWQQFESSRQELQDQQQQCREWMREVQNQLVLNRRDQDHLAGRRQQAEQRLAQEQDRQRSLEEQQKQGETERNSLTKQLAQLDCGLRDQAEQLASLEEWLTAGRSRRQQHSTRLDELKGEMVDVLSSKAQAHNSVVAARRRLQELEHRAARRRQESTELAPKLNAADLAIGDLEDQAAELRDRLALLRETQTRLRDETQQVRTRLQTLRQDWQQLDDRYRQDHSRLKALQELDRRYEWYHQDVRKLLMEQRPKDGSKASVDVLARFLEVNPASMQAAEAVFGDLLQALVTDSFDDLQSLMGELKRHQGARAQFLPLPLWRLVEDRAGVSPDLDNGHRPLIGEIRAAESVRPLLERLLSRVFLAEDWADALDQWLAAPFTSSFVTLEGDCLFADGRVLVRSPDAGQSLLHKRHEISELEQRCAELQGRCAAQEAQLKAAQRERDDLEQRLAGTEQETRSVEETLRQTEQTCLGLQSERQKWLAKQELIGAETLRDDEERQFHQETLDTDEVLVKNLSRAEYALRGQLEELDKTLGALQAEVEAAEADYLQRKIAQSQDQQHQRQALKELERLDQQLSEAGVRLATSQEQQQLAERDLQQCEQQRKDLENQQQDLELQQRNHEQQLQQLETSHLEFKRQQTELEVRRDQLKELYRLRQRNEQKWQAELTEASLQLDFLRRRILEHHRVELERWRSDDELDLIPQEELQRQLEESRQRLEKLGEARYAAIDEFEEQKQRLDFLETQHQDLDRSIQDLQQTIQQIQRTSRKLFLETLSTVDASLHQVFPVLFGGGSARLQLLNEDHPLESGVELLVKLPGKRTAAMSLLSGGEKALTAMALLFAISMTRPSPFLLLDEVDAPLDDVNVGHFCDLLNTLQQRSQVILVSHNQRTMEIAHQLIGITMDEPGVSRVIPLILEQRN